MSRLRLLIADDEPLNRQELRFLLEGCEDIEIVAEADSASAALAAIERTRVDLAFLDIEMEGPRSGLELGSYLSRLSHPPAIIFLTAHPEYALETFRHFPLPLHYLGKPIDEMQLSDALERARLQNAPARLAIKYRETLASGETIFPVAFVAPKEIAYVRKNPMNNTLTVYLADNRMLEGVRLTLEQFNKSLGKRAFLHPHHSFLVNPVHVSALTPRQPGGELMQLMLSGRTEKIPVSRHRLADVKAGLASVGD